MKMMKQYITALCLVLLSVCYMSCSQGDTLGASDFDQDNNEQEDKKDEETKKEEEQITYALNEVCTDWTFDFTKVKEQMSKYPLKSQYENYLEYDKGNGVIFAYSFQNEKLKAATVVIPTNSKDIDNKTILKDYTYIGDINTDKVYVLSSANSMLATNSKNNNGQEYSVYGFAPIESDLYKYVESPKVTTTSAASITTTSATVNGKVANVSSTATCGFIYSKNSDMTGAITTSTTSSTSSFKTTLSNLSIGTTYYYQAFAIVDGIYYYGDVEKFTTVYVKTYKVGDLYPNEAKPEGVVFYISNSGEHGKIVSLDQTYVQWDKSGIFCTNYGCTSNTNGKLNNMGASLPLASWINKRGGDWYCPALNEMKSVAYNREVINNTLTKHGYTILKGIYWTSTEYNSNQAYVVFVFFDRYADGYSTYYQKDNSCSARAIKTF